MEMMDLYVIHNVQNVMTTDSNPSIRPMTQDAQDPQSVSNLFDSIAYAKCTFCYILIMKQYNVNNFLFQLVASLICFHMRSLNQHLKKD